MKSKNRIQLIHWNRDEARERARFLEEKGFRVDWEPPQGAEFLRRVKSDPPDAIIIDLTRLPSQGRDMGIHLRKQKATRSIPLIFVEGDPVKVGKVRRLLPDAVFADFQNLPHTIRNALLEPPRNPVVPESVFDAYKGKSLPVKLGIKSGMVVELKNAPAGFESQLSPLPPDTRLLRSPAENASLILWFVRSHGDLTEGLKETAAILKEASIWIAWPKKKSAVQSDLTQQIVRESGLGTGLVDYKICSVDETWSALCFTRRKNKK
jgi:hypothetical protein